MEGSAEDTRGNEWYVPKRGPRRLRLFIGMTFFPYSLMNASYVVIGSLLAPAIHWDRAGALALVYLLAVGVSAHALDAMGPNKPWGSFLSRRQLEALAVGALIPALGIGLPYSLTYAPYLLVVGVLELFFLLAYNLELFDHLFHTDFWFSVSWGFLPVLAGYVIQTNTIGPTALAGGLFGFATAFIEISASRPYKLLKRNMVGSESTYAARFESVLKGAVSSVLVTTVLLSLLRVIG